MRFSRPNRRLQDTFPPSEQGVYPQPTEVSDTVNLVHEYPAREWEQVVSAQLTSTNVVTPTLQTLAPSREEWNEILFGDVSHTSITARVLQLRLLSPTGFNTFVARWVNIVSALTPGQPGGFEPLFGEGHLVSAAAISSQIVRPRSPLIVPPGWILFLDGDTAGAAYQVSLSIIFARRFLADRPLSF